MMRAHCVVVIVAFLLAVHVRAHAQADAAEPTPPTGSTDGGVSATPAVVESPQPATMPVPTAPADGQATALSSHRLVLLDDERPPPQAHRGRRWYGWQTLLADGLSLSLIIVGIEAPQAALAGLGICGLLLATPIVHSAHNNSAGYVSLSLRLVSAVLIVVGFASALSAALAEDGSHASTGEGLLLVGLLGLGTTIVVDAGLFAFDSSARVSNDPPRAALRPWLDARSGSGGLVFAGTL